MTKFRPINSNVLIQKIESGGLVIAGQEEDPNAIITGKIVAIPDELFINIFEKKAKFIRGQARAIKLDGQDYFLIEHKNILMVGEEDA